MPLQCICADDEPLALGLITSYIKRTPFLQLSGSHSSATDALEAARNGGIDLAFLDIQMPGLNGIALARLLNQLPGQIRPALVFTTAYNHFALEAYKVDAIDYLMKPFNYEEFLRACNKANTLKELMNARRTGNPQAAATDYTAGFFFIRVEYRMVKVYFDDVLYIEGLKDYVKVVLRPPLKSLLSLTSLKTLDEKLPPGRFTRIHRSFIVSNDKIESVSRNKVQIADRNITIGEQYKDTFNEFMSCRS